MAPAPLKILLVEDDFATRRIMQKILELHGSCDVAVNGKEALHAVEMAQIAGEPYRLICLDIMMPELDGREALRKIRQAEGTRGVLSGDGCKVIMTTAMGDAANVMGAFTDQCDAYLVKPISRQKLVDELDKLGLLAGSPHAEKVL
jgi:two-component system, chemotaxis family, chemotaxis protein CheY